MVEWKSTLKTVFVGQVNCEKLYKIVLSKLVQLRRSCVVFETWVKVVFQDGSDVSLSCLYAKFKVDLLSFF